MTATVAPPPLVQPKPWGFWATVGLSLAILAMFVTVQTIVSVGFIVVRHLPLTELKALESNGLLMSLATLTSAPLAGGMTVLFAMLRKPMSVREYLALKFPTWRQVWLSVLALAVYCAMTDWLSVSLNRPIVPDVMVDAYRSAGSVPLMWLTLMVAAPLFEEIFFRGFLFTGLQHSRLGSVGAIALTSLAWATIHAQYDLVGMLFIFVAGLLLGTVRVRTGSVSLCILLHALMNTAATFETIWLIQNR
jgi:membrane protease YdiL (CAAX protease family)